MSEKGRRLFLVRHGQTAWNASGRAQGQTDVCLDEAGLAQAERAATALAAADAEEIWSSDLARCASTAEPIARACGSPIARFRELRERSFGSWEGDVLADIRLRLEELARERGIAIEAARPPGGESLEDVWQRIVPITERLFEARRTLILVSHGGVMSLLLASLLKATVATARSFRPRNASISELERRAEGGFRLVRWDDVSHLR